MYYNISQCARKAHGNLDTPAVTEAPGEENIGPIDLRTTKIIEEENEGEGGEGRDNTQSPGQNGKDENEAKKEEVREAVSPEVC